MVTHIIFKRGCRRMVFVSGIPRTKLLFDEYVVSFFENSNSERNERGKRCCSTTVPGVETSGLRPLLSIRCAITNFVRKTSFVLWTNGFFEPRRVRTWRFVFFF